MKKRNYLSIILLVLVAAFTMVACEKDKTLITLDFISAEDDAIADLAYDDVFTEVDAVMNTMDMLGYVMPANKSGLEIFETCKVISVEQPDGEFWPRTITVDYGEGCKIGNRTRAGKIIIIVSGPMWQEGSLRVITFEEFYVNEHKIEGTRTVTNEGRHAEGEYAGMLYKSVVLDSGKVTTPEGQVITKQVNRTRTFIAGEESKWDTRDDIWHIEGIAEGVNRNGVAFTREITSPLWKQIGCRFITQGTVLISAEGSPDAILDYGEGDCDAIATVTIGEETREINLKIW